MKGYNYKASLVDVRTKGEFAAKNVKGSINLPMHEVVDNLSFLRELNRPIIVFCRSGNRSGWVRDYLSDKGLENVFNGGSVEQVQELIDLNKI